jgi:hypothetical protein
MSYWNNHYKNGGVSGEGDTRDSHKWKMSIMDTYGIGFNNSVIDVGCGDMEFWKYFPVNNYTGIDISQHIIDKNRNKYPKYNFYCADSSFPLNISANCVTCFDLLFHIMDTEKYIKTLDNLVHYTKQKLFIYTWVKNPFDDFKNKLLIGKPFARDVITDGKFQYYRNFDRFSIRYIEPHLKLIDTRTDARWPYGCMYIYDKTLK